MELSNDHSTADIYKVSAEEASGDEFEVNEVYRNGKQGYNNNYRKGNYGNNQNFSNKPCYNSRAQDNKTGKNWEHKEKDSKITLLQESSHFVLAKFSDSFFRQFNLAMKLRREELKKQGKVHTEMSEITEGDMVHAFGVTEDPAVSPINSLYVKD